MNTHYTPDNLLEIKDIAVAAYLYSSEQVIFVGTKRLANRDVIFQFSPQNKARELIQAYWNLQAPLIQPRQLFNAQRDLKDIIFSHYGK